MTAWNLMFNPEIPLDLGSTLDPRGFHSFGSRF
jgi:hypothetical protein